MWNAAVEPLGAKTRFETSRLNLNEKMRVVSAANATACRSNISLTCSSNESGTPIGAPGSSRGSPVWFDCFDLLDAPLDLAHVVEVIGQPRAIGRAELAARSPTDSATQSRMLWSSLRRARRASGVAPTPNS